MRHLDLSPQETWHHACEASSTVADACIQREGDHRLAAANAVDGGTGDACVDCLNAAETPWLIRIGWCDVSRIVTAAKERCGERAAQCPVGWIKRPHDETRAGEDEAVVAVGVAKDVERVDQVLHARIIRRIRFGLDRLYGVYRHAYQATRGQIRKGNGCDGESMLHRVLIDKLHLGEVVEASDEVEHVAGEGNGRAAEAELGIVSARLDTAAQRHVECINMHDTRTHIEVGNPVYRRVWTVDADTKGGGLYLQRRRPEQPGIGIIEGARVAQERASRVAVARKWRDAIPGGIVDRTNQQLTRWAVDGIRGVDTLQHELRRSRKGHVRRLAATEIRTNGGGVGHAVETSYH